MQAAGLIGTLRSLGTNGAEVSFINQPDLDAGQVRPRLLHRTADELVQQVLHRLLMSDIQEQVRGEIRIEPIVTIWFHDGGYLSEAGRFLTGRFLNSTRTILRTFRFSSLPNCHFKPHPALAMSELRNSQVIGTSAA